MKKVPGQPEEIKMLRRWLGYFPSLFQWGGDKVIVESVIRTWTTDKKKKSGKRLTYKLDRHYFQVKCVGGDEALIYQDLVTNKWYIWYIGTIPGTPTRIQRKREKGWRQPPNTVFVGRPTRWGNPFRVKTYGGQWIVVRGTDILAQRDTRESAVDQALNCFMDYLSAMSTSERDELIAPLRGKNVSCWCPDGERCHGDVWLELANGSNPL